MRQWHTSIWRDEEVKGLHYIVDKPWEKRVASDGIGGHLGRDGETHTWWWNVWHEWRLEREGELLNIMDELVAKPLSADADKRQCQENRNKGLPIPISLAANGNDRSLSCADAVPPGTESTAPNQLFHTPIFTEEPRGQTCFFDKSNLVT